MDIELKELTIINKYEEFKKYFLLGRSYILRQPPDKQEKTIKYFYKKLLLVITKDNYILELEKSASISSTLFFNDEDEAPKLSEQYFIYYNLSNMPHRNITAYLDEKRRLSEDGCASGKYDYNGIYLRDYKDTLKVNFSFYSLEPTEKKYLIRYLTEQEEIDLLNIIQKIQTNYIERLKRYYKRYGHKITCLGYWANR